MPSVVLFFNVLSSMNFIKLFDWKENHLKCDKRPKNNHFWSIFDSLNSQLAYILQKKTFSNFQTLFFFCSLCLFKTTVNCKGNGMLFLSFPYIINGSLCCNLYDLLYLIGCVLLLLLWKKLTHQQKKLNITALYQLYFTLTLLLYRAKNYYSILSTTLFW